MNILKIYKELRDVIIYERDDGTLVIKSMYEVEATDEEQEVIKQLLLPKDNFNKENINTNVETSTA